MNRKRITIGFFIGMIAVSVSSLSFSIAWYASSNFLRVDPIDIAIQAERDLKISTTNEINDFKDSLSKDDGDLNIINIFAPVSSINSEEWILNRADAPKFYDCSRTWTAPGVPPMEEIEVDDYYYYSQEFYLYADDDVFVTIDTEQTYLKTDEIANAQYAQKYKNENPETPYTVEEIKEQLNELNKAMRISLLVPGDDFYEYYIIDPNKEENKEVYFCGALDNSKNRYYDNYQYDGEIYETVYGDIKNRDKIIYDDLLADDSVIEGEANAFNARHMANTHPFNFQKTLDNGAEIGMEHSLSLQDIENNQSLIKIPVYDGYQNTRKIIVSIYIEGWDLKSINSTMGASFLANLSFKILREM